MEWVIKNSYLLINFSQSTCTIQFQVIMPSANGPLTRYVKLQVVHAPGMPGTFSPAADFKENRLLAIPACITARAWRTCRDACRDRLHAVTGKTFPAFAAHAHPQFYVSGKRPINHWNDPITHAHTSYGCLPYDIVFIFNKLDHNIPNSHGERALLEV